MSRSNEAVFVAADIKYDQVPNFVRTWKYRSQRIETLETVVRDQVKPTIQSRFAVGMLSGKFSERFTGNDVHIQFVLWKLMTCILPK
jgi:hypothetical protein